MKKTLLLSISLILLIVSCNRDSYRKASGATWGTFYHITYHSPRNLDDSIVSVMRDINMSLSPFEHHSLVSKINNNESDSTDAMLADVFTLSQRICQASGGAFDPTVAPLVNIWGFGYKAGMSSPDSASIDSALKSVGILDCQLVDGHIAKKTPETEFNFSAIAKGYGVDKIAQMLERNGVADYMVEIGGEIAVKGVNVHGDKWRIQIDAPVEDGEAEIKHERLEMLHLTDCAVATSGNYRNYRRTSEGKIGHTISPVTGRPIISNMLSATIIAPNCAVADALATAAMALPDSTAISMIESFPGVKAILVVQQPGSAYHVIRIPE